MFYILNKHSVSCEWLKIFGKEVVGDRRMRHELWALNLGPPSNRGSDSTIAHQLMWNVMSICESSAFIHVCLVTLYFILRCKNLVFCISLRKSLQIPELHLLCICSHELVRWSTVTEGHVTSKGFFTSLLILNHIGIWAIFHFFPHDVHVSYYVTLSSHSF